MRAVQVIEPGMIELRDVVSTGEGVRISVASAGICGSDLHLVAMGLPDVTLGHEISGLLDDGTAVVVEPLAACGHCNACRAGQKQRCYEVTQRIYGVALDGGIADEIVVEPQCVLPIPPTIDPADAALIEPFAVAVHGLNRADVSPGEKVVVIGGGAIGLSTLAVARHRGICADLIARHRHQYAAGEALGATVARRDDYDVAVDAAGSQSSIEAAIQRVRPGGRILLLGSWFCPVALGTDLGVREITVVPSSLYGHDHGVREFTQAIEVLATRPDTAATLITHRFALADAAEAFRVAGDRAAGAIKVVIQP